MENFEVIYQFGIIVLHLNVAIKQILKKFTIWQDIQSTNHNLWSKRSQSIPFDFGMWKEFSVCHLLFEFPPNLLAALMLVSFTPALGSTGPRCTSLATPAQLLVVRSHRCSVPPLARLFGLSLCSTHSVADAQPLARVRRGREDEPASTLGHRLVGYGVR